MPTISLFYGITISLYFMDNKQHNKAHIHARYQGDEAVLSIADSEVLSGSLPNSKMILLKAWMEIHREDLLANWELAVSGQNPFKIDPLR